MANAITTTIIAPLYPPARHSKLKYFFYYSALLVGSQKEHAPNDRYFRTQKHPEHAISDTLRALD